MLPAALAQPLRGMWGGEKEASGSRRRWLGQHQYHNPSQQSLSYHCSQWLFWVQNSYIPWRSSKLHRTVLKRTGWPRSHIKFGVVGGGLRNEGKTEWETRHTNCQFQKWEKKRFIRRATKKAASQVYSNSQVGLKSVHKVLTVTQLKHSGIN